MTSKLHKKAKSRKSVTRRFKVTATGKVLHRSSFQQHLRSHKASKQLRRYKVAKPVTGRVARRIKRLMALA